MIDTITFRAILLLTKRLKQITCAHVDLSLFKTNQDTTLECLFCHLILMKPKRKDK